MDFKLIAAFLWDYVSRFGVAVWSSLGSFVATPSVWLAAPLFLFGGFALGHWERGHVVTRLSGEKSELMVRIDGLTADLNSAIRFAREVKAAYDAEVAKRPPPAAETPAIDKTKSKRRAEAR